MEKLHVIWIYWEIQSICNETFFEFFCSEMVSFLKFFRDNSHSFFLVYMMMANCFCGIVVQQKTLSFISTWDLCQRSSSSQVSNMPRVRFASAHNLSSGFVKCCAVVLSMKYSIPLKSFSFSFFFTHFLSLYVTWEFVLSILLLLIYGFFIIFN